MLVSSPKGIPAIMDRTFCPGPSPDARIRHTFVTLSLGFIERPHLHAGVSHLFSVILRRSLRVSHTTLASALTALDNATQRRYLRSCCLMSTLGLGASESCDSRMFQALKDQVHDRSISIRSDQNQLGDVHCGRCMHEPKSSRLHSFRSELFQSHSVLGPSSHACMQLGITNGLCYLAIGVLHS